MENDAIGLLLSYYTLLHRDTRRTDMHNSSIILLVVQSVQGCAHNYSHKSVAAEMSPDSLYRRWNSRNSRASDDLSWRHPGLVVGHVTARWRTRWVSVYDCVDRVISSREMDGELIVISWNLRLPQVAFVILTSSIHRSRPMTFNSILTVPTFSHKNRRVLVLASRGLSANCTECKQHDTETLS